MLLFPVPLNYCGWEVRKAIKSSCLKQGVKGRHFNFRRCQHMGFQLQHTLLRNQTKQTIDPPTQSRSNPGFLFAQFPVDTSKPGDFADVLVVISLKQTRGKCSNNGEISSRKGSRGAEVRQGWGPIPQLTSGTCSGEAVPGFEPTNSPDGTGLQGITVNT